MQRLKRTLQPWLFLLAACASPPSGPAAQAHDGADVIDRARAALDQGDLRTAHTILQDQLIREALIEVNSLADGGDLELSLARAEELLAMAPEVPSAQDARRRTALLLVL